MTMQLPHLITITSTAFDYGKGNFTPDPMMVPTCEKTSVGMNDPSISTRNLDSNH